jgi:hypothetical protein
MLNPKEKQLRLKAIPVLKAAKKTGYQFKIRGKRTGRLYRADNEKIAEITRIVRRLDNCPHLHPLRSSYILTVSQHNQTIHAAFINIAGKHSVLSKPTFYWMIGKVLSGKPKHLFAYADILVYNGIGYQYHTSAYAILLKALAKNTNPAIEALLQK